jgi:hypothetical protein
MEATRVLRGIYRLAAPAVLAGVVLSIGVSWWRDRRRRAAKTEDPETSDYGTDNGPDDEDT